ncbi:MAG TPA: phage integrase SAM-like domain-containing protein, partial [Urbifossiella sp.]|nr:phage integrase SAM-like domain-containing protein [Urbifossiella sp.]
ELLRRYEADPDGDGKNKSCTIANHRSIATHMLTFFKEATAVRSINATAATEFKAHVTELLGPGTIGRLLRHCRTVFKFAAKKGYIATNPFADVSAPSPLDPERQAAYAEASDVETLIAAAPQHMKIILALARYCGLWCPSEALKLKWTEVYLDRDTPEMLVHAPKTEHHAGKGTRVVPVFAALRPHLEAARRASAPGAVYVVAGEWADRQRERTTKAGGAKNVNLSNQFDPVLKAAGLPGWPAPFVTFRASCQTDLHHIPGLTADTIARWMGHSAVVGSQHYHRIWGEEGRLAATVVVAGKRDAESDARATQNPTADRSGPETTGADKADGFPCKSRLQSGPVRSGLLGADRLCNP